MLETMESGGRGRYERMKQKTEWKDEGVIVERCGRKEGDVEGGREDMEVKGRRENQRANESE